ncbi:MAG: hybrid sensor histidine kinase/response regulator [Planctomycetia bacterium]|nr:hybrid sensor histidine kinase/response regulator [Planctomycetia bacterium]
MFQDESIIQDFVTESNEHLAHVESQLLEIEAGGANSNIETVNALFRAVHSIKGAAGFLGFDTVAKLAHSLENVMDLVRNRALTPTAETVDVLLRSCDQLKSLINDLANSNGADVSALVSALDGVANMNSNHVPEPFDPNTFAKPTPTPPIETVEIVAPPLAPTPTPIIEHVETPVSATANNSAPAPAASSEATPAADANIRVSVGLLDRLMNLAGELVLSRNQLLQAVNSLGRPEVETISSRLDQVTSELQEAVMQTRMQPLANVFSRFPRLVRDLSAKLGKQCDLNISGKDVEVDKSIIEAIGDPLVHLVRNSLDHGVELPDVRSRKGKKPIGAIALEASHQAGRVLIVVRDDGAGIDPIRLRSKAVSKGILTAELAAALSDEDAVNLIFHPGFSTAETITDVSGRGVGMDVVKSNITKLGGTVEVVSELGRGTTILVKLPLTLAIIPSLIVHSGNAPFAISQASIVELVRVSANEADKRISTINGSEVLKLRGRLLPLVRLGKILANAEQRQARMDLDESRTPRNLDIIVVDAGAVRYGLIVDGLQDSEEIVVKPLGRHLKGSICLAGATILGDGRVAFILDANGIAAYAELQRSDSQAEQDEDASGSGAEETQAALMLTNGPEEYFAIPMAVIKRLERVQKEQVHEVGGQRLLEYEKETLTLLALDDLIRAEPRPDQAWLYVVVFEAGGREIGLIVPKLVEIRQLSTNVDFRTLREPGVIGSLVVDRRTVRLLDVHELASKGCPQLTVPAEEEGLEDVRELRIMLVEDSNFFRTQVSHFLETLGHDVVAFEDGQAAWEALQDPKRQVDLVVTDIEMPRMNGFELCRRIKTDARFDGLPVIALTSLAGEDDVAHGREVGIDDYQVKMDRDKLLTAVRRLLPNRRAELLSV